MTARAAMVVGEALVDLVETGAGDDTVYRPLVGGAPLNVAAGLARLGATVEFVAAVSTDPLGQRVWDLLGRLGVGTRCCVRVGAPTTLAVTSLRDAVPEFTFYGESFAHLGPQAIDRDLVASVAVLYCGSIGLMYSPSREAAREAWATHGPLKVLDPNVRPNLLVDRDALRRTVEEFASTADVVKLSAPDAAVLFELEPMPAARHLRSVGAAAVVVTLGADGAFVMTDAATIEVAAPAADVVDTTGAGDAHVAALMYGLLNDGPPVDEDGWRILLGFANTAAALACQVPGGATAMPALEAIRALRG
jgi:fructokinase